MGTRPDVDTMPDVTLGDVATIDALPAATRRLLSEMMFGAFLAGYDTAKRYASSDARTGASYLHVAVSRQAAAELFWADEVRPVVGDDLRTPSLPAWDCDNCGSREYPRWRCYCTARFVDWNAASGAPSVGATEG